MSRVLIVCYSRSGYTASLVNEIVAMTGWERTDISDRHPRFGAWGALRCAIDALLRRRPPIVAEHRQLGAYDFIVVAAPVWLRSLAAPMRTYLTRHHGEIRGVAYVCTYGGDGATQAAEQVQQLAGVPLRATLAVTAHELEQADYRRRLDAFLAALKEAKVA